MAFAKKSFNSWPRWLRILFSIFGFLFIALVLILVARIISGPSLIENNGPPLSTLADILVLFLTSQAISLTLKQGKNFRTVLISIFFGLAGIFLVFVLESFRSFAVDYIDLKIRVRGLNNYVSYLENAIREIDPSFFPSSPQVPPPIESQPSAGSSESTILIITAVSGLITALTGLYGQIVSARKIRGELEIAKGQLALEQKKIELEARKENKEE